MPGVELAGLRCTMLAASGCTGACGAVRGGGGSSGYGMAVDRALWGRREGLRASPALCRWLVRGPDRLQRNRLDARLVNPANGGRVQV